MNKKALLVSIMCVGTLMASGDGIVLSEIQERNVVRTDNCENDNNLKNADDCKAWESVKIDESIDEYCVDDIDNNIHDFNMLSFLIDDALHGDVSKLSEINEILTKCCRKIDLCAEDTMFLCCLLQMLCAFSDDLYDSVYDKMSYISKTIGTDIHECRCRKEIVHKMKYGIYDYLQTYDDSVLGEMVI